MSDKPYVDPNSGAAPQPGGYAGAEAAEKGFAIPAEYEVQEEKSPAEYEAPYANGGTGQVTVPEVDTEKSDLALSLSNPKQVLADLHEGETVKSEDDEFSDTEKDNAASVEHQAVDPANPDGVYDPSQYSVAEVNEYLAANPDQRDAVLAAERDGKARKTITEA